MFSIHFTNFIIIIMFFTIICYFFTIYSTSIFFVFFIVPLIMC
ncbi:unnamed protein product [Schistosoma margrebowiei]|uniref:Uncharacterized protein n=1 Tax=Schistosoma margrebowiei TaxID=48269 RepID=A0A3P7WWG8_9TREM|nr:unnamed protein product [Schistosoma margrebowiei]